MHAAVVAVAVVIAVVLGGVQSQFCIYEMIIWQHCALQSVLKRSYALLDNRLCVCIQQQQCAYMKQTACEGDKLSHLANS
jgi:hypothetical protein